MDLIEISKLFTRILLLPVYVLLWLTPHFRPRYQWNFNQAIRIYVARVILNAITLRRQAPILSNAPGKERDCFVLIQPASPAAYTGITRIDDSIRPTELGLTWYPERLKSVDDIRRVIMHFHGGGYVLGDGRKDDAGFLAQIFLDVAHSHVSHVVCPQYRLSRTETGRFPAALQDAITSYVHLIRVEKLRASQIVLSGDSAGGNLALALLRYLQDHGQSLSLELPQHIWLWSPFLDAFASWERPHEHDQSIHSTTDYTTGAFGLWAAESFMPRLSTGIGLHHPYIQACGNPFSTAAKVFVSVGECEIFAPSITRFAQQMSDIQGNNVCFDIVENAPHDVLLMGGKIGFQREARLSAAAAIQTLKNG